MRGLAWFWVLLLLVAGGSAAVLHLLGPLHRAMLVLPTAPPGPAGLGPGAPANGPGAARPPASPAARSPAAPNAQPFDRSDTRPRIGIIVTGLGLAELSGADALLSLPLGITFAVSETGPQLQPLLDRVRARGSELLVSIPTPRATDAQGSLGSADRGLRADLPPEVNERRLIGILAGFTGYVGATTSVDRLGGERYADSPARLATLGQLLAARGLLYVDPRPGVTLPPGFPARTVDLVLDDPPGRAEIEAKLAQLERLARERGSALGLAGPPRPALMERLSAWATSLPARGLALAPVSVLVSPSAQQPGVQQPGGQQPGGQQKVP